MTSVKVIVTGNVQGVGFRYYTQLKAQELGINGYVKNEFDGTVLVVATASDEVIEKFISWLSVGPRSANVKNIRVKYLKESQDFKGFKVKYT